MRLCLFQPDIPQNTGTLLRLGACLDIGIDIIEPCGFIFDDKKVKRAVMDYMDKVDCKRHHSWEEFLEYKKDNSEQYGRIILLSTKAATNFTEFEYKENDLLLLGRESAGVPDEVHNFADERVIIPMNENARSINVAISGAMVLSEAMKQTGLFK